LRNSVSGDGSYRDQSTSFRDRTRSMGSFPRERPGASGTPTRESNSSFWPQQSNTACSSPIVQNMPSSHSPKNNNMDSPGRNGQNGARMIRPSAWPPHPDREIEEKEIWSPEKTNGLNIFEDVTTEPSLVPFEEETKVSPFTYRHYITRIFSMNTRVNSIMDLYLKKYLVVELNQHL